MLDSTVNLPAKLNIFHDTTKLFLKIIGDIDFYHTRLCQRQLLRELRNVSKNTLKYAKIYYIIETEHLLSSFEHG